MDYSHLIEKAIVAKENAYVPYSKFQVGAALQTVSGNIYTGCNIENASYPVTCCAERVAIFKAISEDETKFVSLAVVANTERPVPPCGACRQVMSEFFEPTMKIYLANTKQAVKVVTMDELLPFSFSTDDLNN